jgi:hypothetical protein
LYIIKKGKSIKRLLIFLTIVLIICHTLFIKNNLEAIRYSNNTNLSAVDASFIGENINDISGYSIDIAGDINGDGYDDIIIGAYGDDKGGSMAGKSYVIFGKSSGWSKKTGMVMMIF